VTEKTVSCVLRIVAVVVVLIGVAWAMSTVLMLANVSRAMNSVTDGNVVSLNMLSVALIVPLVVLAEGWLLWLLSPAIARRLVA
jgi:uncharacterized membrane protein YidH (DUF202 family)